MNDQHLQADELGTVQNLKPESSGEIKLTPETLVLCRNRGREVYVDMFDSQPYRIEPGYFLAPYGAALHFKARAVVPGSRNPETNFQASFITIIGATVPAADGGVRVVKAVDPADDWPMFTDEECRAYGHAVEALDRASLVDPIDPDATVHQISGVGNSGVAPASKPSRVKSTGGKGASSRKPNISGDTKKLLRKGKTETNDAIREINEGLAEKPS